MRLVQLSDEQLMMLGKLITCQKANVLQCGNSLASGEEFKKLEQLQYDLKRDFTEGLLQHVGFIPIERCNYVDGKHTTSFITVKEYYNYVIDEIEEYCRREK